ncbi:hypothetical protein G9A89_020871 [Geosiphon pyriformis]|nr:hypothetical protein G9A89_020871 [Geosiphon pyriformis]
MGVFKTTTRTAVTEWIERLTTERYQEEDLSEIFHLCEVINLQENGPKEASKAIRGVFKYGLKHAQLRILTILKALVENCGSKFQTQIATQKFIDRITSHATSSSTDPQVRKKLIDLLLQWQNDFKGEPGMTILSQLYQYVAGRNNNGYPGRQNPYQNTTATTSRASPSSNIAQNEKRTTSNSSNSGLSKSSGPDEKPISAAKINEEIGIANQYATNLINAITLLPSGTSIEALNGNEEIQKYLQKCREISKELAKIIQKVTDGAQLGPLLQTNDQLMGALQIYEDLAENILFNDNSDIQKNQKSEEFAKNNEDLFGFGTLNQSSSLYQSSNIRQNSGNLIDFDAFISPPLPTYVWLSYLILHFHNKSIRNTSQKQSSIERDPFADPDPDLEITQPHVPTRRCNSRRQRLECNNEPMRQIHGNIKSEITEFVESLANILKTSDESNIIIRAGEPPNTKEFKAHTLILRNRSLYFRAALSQEWVKKEGELVVFKKPNISPCVFEIILRYMYTGIVDLDQHNGADIFHLLLASDELEIPELITYAQEHLIAKKTWISENIVTVYQAVNLHETFNLLKSQIDSLWKEDGHLFFESVDFTLLDEGSLLKLLNRQDLGLHEIEIWNFLIEWGTTNANIEEQDTTKWTESDFEALQNCIGKFFPLIRFYDILPKEYTDYVAPFQHILTKEIRTKLLSYFTEGGQSKDVELDCWMTELPPRSIIKSAIITSQQANWITLRIDKEELTPRSDRTNPYNFHLLYRATRDGFGAKAFRKACASKQKTITVAKIAGSDIIIGGYNPSDWGSEVDLERDIANYQPSSNQEGHRFDPDTAIFSFPNGQDITQAKFATSSNENKTVVFHPNYGPCFYNDLFIGNQCNIVGSSWYRRFHFEDDILDTWNVQQRKKLNFKIENYEVFQIFPKN